MKKIIAIVLALIMVISLCACSTKKTVTDDYQFMYDGMVDEWNKLSSSDVEDLFGFGEYMYNSYLILFPRETPSTLADYYFYWSAGIDVDSYAIYFTCKLTEENYKGFCDGLGGFEMKYPDYTVKPIYDDKNFSLPTYVLQWVNVGEKWEVLEYVMLDDANKTAVFVYTMSELDKIEENSSYKVKPKKDKVTDGSFSIYGQLEDDDSYIYFDEFKRSEYDISFLEYLK